MTNFEKSKSKLERLDQYVAKKLPLLTRSFASRLIADQKVKINGVIVDKPGHKLQPTDKVIIDFQADTSLRIPEIKLPIIYEDNDVVVINKPVGILSHSKGQYNSEATVASWLSARVVGLTGDRAGVVHRLDRATSGVMICAKNPDASSWLQKQFSKRNVKKKYVAITDGIFKHQHALIDKAIIRNPKKPQTFKVSSNGKSALTEYKILSEKNNHSLVELKPVTGRTHQLRVHLASVGHPIHGDVIYKGSPGARLFLHATDLEITLPNKERKVFTVPVPSEFSKEMEAQWN